VLSVEDWAEIRRLHRAERMPIKAIARVMGVSRNTVRAAVASDRPPRYERPARGSIVDAVEPRIRELLQAYPTMPATVIAERIGWDRSVRVLRDRVAELRPAYLPPDPASRTAYVAGEVAQCDFWFPPIMLPVGCGRWRAGRPELTADCQAFRGTLGAKVVVCKPADPEAKGLVERAHDYLERSFLPGRAFAGPADFNAQLAAWLALVNTRPRRALGCSPAERITADRAAMLTLPPVAPQTGWRAQSRLARDHYVRLDANDYSVHPAVIGRRIAVMADLARVRVLCDGQVVADHQRSWAWHQSISDPGHIAAARAMRRDRVTALHRPPEPEVQIRALADYDAALGTGGGVA